MVSSPGKLMEKRRWGVENFWQVLFVLGVALGAYASAFLSVSATAAMAEDKKAKEEAAAAISTAARLLSGFLTVFGAMMAGGCPVSHGIGGVALLGNKSLIAVAVAVGTAVAASQVGVAKML